ncbi:MAG: DUF285 domain-containing protein [Bacteroidales bacterium]|nr:DUF285 domain-containing protein [Bacteroidales bacterium]
MKKSLFAIAAAAAVLAGCQQESFNQKDNAKNDGIFYATIENNETRSALQADGDVYHVAWDGGDQIVVATPDFAYTVKYEAYEGGTTAGFMKVNEADTTLTGEEVVAYYPARYFSSASVTPYLPATQGYVAGNVAYNPMYATSTDENLPFKNLCGILKLNVTTTAADAKVKSISFSSDQGFTGEYKVEDNAAVLVNPDNLVLNCGEGVAIGATAVPFYVVVPANTYTNLEIKLETTDGRSQTLKMKADKNLTVERSKIYEGDFAFNSLEGAPVLGGLCTLGVGEEVCLALKSLTDPTATFAKDTKITNAVKRIILSPRNPSTAGLIVSDLDSECPAYATYDPIADEITIASVADKFELGYDASSMFYGFRKCEEIVGLTELSTENCENMAYLFAYCSAMKEFDLSNFNTDNCTALDHMFWYCQAATKIDVTSFNTENNCSMWSMFCHCDNIESLDVSNFNTGGVTTMSYAFAYCYKLQNLDLSSFDASATTTVSYLVYDCRELKTLKLGALFDTSHDPTMSYMFCRCPYLGEVWFGPSFISSKKPSNFWGYTGTDDFSNGDYVRTGNKAGGITIHCTQDTADWLATTGLRWFPSGYNEANGHTPIPVNFVEYTTGMPLTVTWSPN